jgi:hypothetical protein
MNLDQDFTNYVDGYDSPGEWIDSDEQQRAGADGGISGEQYERQRAGANGGISAEQDEQQRARADGGLDAEDDQQRHAGADEGLDEEEDEVTPSKKELLGDVEAEWVKSERNQEKVSSQHSMFLRSSDFHPHLQLIFRGALYTINGLSKSGDYLYARCDRRDGCTSRLWLTVGEKLLHLHTGKHNHEPKPWRPENAKLNDQQMDLIEANTDLVSAVPALRPTHSVGGASGSCLDGSASARANDAEPLSHSSRLPSDPPGRLSQLNTEPLWRWDLRPMSDVGAQVRAGG